MIIDEKGRLFGKINIIDLLVVMFLLSLILPVFYFIYKVNIKLDSDKKARVVEFERVKKYREAEEADRREQELKEGIARKEKESKEEQARQAQRRFLDLNINCLFIELEPNVITKIKKGDQDIDKEGRVLAKILKTGRVTNYVYEFDIGGTKKLLEEDSCFKQMRAFLRIKTEIKDKKLYFKGDQLLFDNTVFELATEKYRAKFVLLYRDDMNFHTKGLEVKINNLENQVETIIKLLRDKLK